MNLVAMDMAVRRRNAKFTVLTRTQGEWSQNETSRLVGGLRPMALVSSLPAQPTKLIVTGEQTRQDLARALGHESFEAEVVVGFDNPNLPFAPPQL